MRRRRLWILLSGLTTLLAWTECLAGQPPAGALAEFNGYSSHLEARLERERKSSFFNPEDAARLRRGALVIEHVDAAEGDSATAPGALLQHWRGTSFVAGVNAEAFETMMRDFGSYPRYFAPEVMQSKVLARQGNAYAVKMRVRQKHVITVVMEVEYEVSFGRVDARRGWSISRSTRVREVGGAGTAGERMLGPDEEHGFLWRQNTYWSYEERDGGLYLQVESVSLSRAIPRGLAWAVGPYVESVPRESLEFTLRATGDALKQVRSDQKGGK